MTIKEASEKWNISERRIRQLIQDGRIEGAEKQVQHGIFQMILINQSIKG